MATAPVSHTPEMGTKSGRACLHCRKRQSFCSKDIPSCLACRVKVQRCVYPDGRKVTVPASYVRDLEARLRAYEGKQASRDPTNLASVVGCPLGITSASSKTQAGPHGSPAGGEQQSSQDYDFELNPLMEDFSNLVLNPSGTPQYLGGASSTMLGRRLRDMVGLINLDSKSLDFDRESSTHNRAALKFRRSSISDSVRLPPLDVAKRLFAAQYTYIGTIFAFVQPELFEEQLEQAYIGPPNIADRDACLSYCQVLLILAFGQLYSSNERTTCNCPPGFEYFTQALLYLPDIHEEGSVLFVGVLSLVGYFMQNLNRRDAAYLYVGNALRMAISLALHHEVSHPGFDESTKEYRRRIWWSVYSLDRILCVKTGNPIAIQDEDIGVSMPSRLPYEPQYCAAITLRHYTELSRISGQILKNLYRRTPKTGSSMMVAVQNIMTALHQWRSTVPVELTFDPAKLHITRESVSTFLHYYQCINLTARPLLFQIVQKRFESSVVSVGHDWKQGLSPTTVKIVEACVDGARDTITMMDIAAQQDRVATWGYLDGEHTFSAAIVLVMVCIALDHTAEDAAMMERAIELLRKIADRGNNHIAARYQLLVHLKHFIKHHDVSAGTRLGSAAIEATVPIAQPPATLFVGNTAMGEPLAEGFDPSDLSIWEAGYHNPDLDMDFNFDPSQWTKEAQDLYDSFAS